MTDPPKKVGRPRSDEESTRVSTWVKGVEYDRLYVIAAKRGESVSSVVRRLIARGLQDPSLPRK